MLTIKKKALPCAIETLASKPRYFSFNRKLLAASACMLTAMSVNAQAQSDDAPAAELNTVTVTGYRGTFMDSVKYQRDVLETPRIVTVLTSDLLEDQNVTELRDALRNVSGISLQAGEGNPPGGDQLKIRGFNARDDINVNGSRDLGNYFRDPFYVDQIEVIKGPNSAFSGRGSAGGTINFVTKQPLMEDRNRLETSVGSDELFRVTGDFNRRIDDNSALRLNVMSHTQDNPGRDVVDQERQGVYAAYVWGLESDTQVEVDFLHTRQNNTPDQGIPIDREGFSGDTSQLGSNGRTSGGQRASDGYYTGALPPGIDYSDYFGHVDDYQDIDVNQLGLAVEHRFSDSLSLRNQLRVSRVENDSLTSSPRLIVPEAAFGSGDFSQVQVRGDLKPRDQTDTSFFNQTDLIVNFDTGSLKHDLVLGAEVGYVDIENRRRPDVRGPATNLYNPTRRTRPEVPYDGTRHRLESEQLGLYALDTIAFSPQWDLHAGVRWDHVESTATDYGWEDPIGPISRTDSEWSGNLGLVFKPTDNGTLYASVGTSFDVTGTFDRGLVQLAGGGSALTGNREDIVDLDAFNTDPEQTVAYELGTKWNVADNLLVSAALFRTDKTNARTPAVGGGDLLNVLDGEQRVEGFEIGAMGSLTPEWKLYTSYTFMDSEVLSSNNPWEVGSRLGGTPEHTFNLWSDYAVTSQWSIGGGMEYVADQVNNVASEPGARRRQVEIDSYTLLHASTAYRFNEELQLRINGFNLADKEYISQLAEGGAQGIPGPGRHVIATLRYDF
ncbi:MULTISPECIES: TonB-dependent siderophore receptor [unclassified Halomonas]|uniref:TonB-dependent receptor n=1 Tax=unclassified Halomonas TaxID=2609666 RepID=UPI001BECB4C5|nr:MULTISPECIES: TonB-dependent siderophore receptor [unclassified Halomonas]MBT2771392.1 TonB-dependent siderophore receptor [Halomonas sp. ISL-60]MBT2801543.1 TonB-dependent siderophore receptor [Halomonas sp. ISL-56]MDQ7730431.1 TonB-dependent siderophore receptor [Halomonas sp. SpR8]